MVKFDLERKEEVARRREVAYYKEGALSQGQLYMTITVYISS